MSTHSETKAQLPLTAVLLAGGKSRRMGTDKALLEIEGQPLWRRQLALLESLEPAEVLVSGPRRPDFPTTLRNVEDVGPSCGPLSGLATALRVATSPHVLVLAINMPHMTRSFLEQLRALRGLRHGVVPFVLERERQEKFYEPLAAIYPRECADLVERHLTSADWSMQSFVRAGVFARLLTEFEIPPAERRCFRNLNAPTGRDGLEVYNPDVKS